MFIGKRNSDDPRRGIPPALRRQLMMQGVFLVLILGLLVVLLRKLSQGDESLRDQVAAPQVRIPVSPGVEDDTPPGGIIGIPDPVSGEGEESELDGGVEDLNVNVEVVQLVDPDPFVEDPATLMHAAVLEAKGEIDIEAVVHLYQKIRSEPNCLSGQPELSDVRGDKVWTELLKSPNKYRGRLIEVRGNIIKRKHSPAPEIDAEILLPFPNPSGVPTLFRTHLYGEESKFFLLSTWRKDREFEHLDGVLFRGLFAQIYSYEVEVGGETTKARIPLLLGSELHPVSTPLPGGQHLAPLFYLAVILPLAAGVVIFVVSWRSNRRVAEFEAARRARRRKPRAAGPESEESSSS